MAEACIHGDVDIEGDLIAALETLRALAESPVSTQDKLTVARAALSLPPPPTRRTDRRARLRGRRHVPVRDRTAVAFHYDLPDASHRTFLDERMLDIGCGWGSPLVHAAGHYGVEGLGVTLAETQATFGREQVTAAGISDRVEIRPEDHRDLDASVDGGFDAVVAVGMVDHVPPDDLNAFLTRVHGLLREVGRFLNHVITTGCRTETVSFGTPRSFIGAYVFPDGVLHQAWNQAREMGRTGFEVVDVEELRLHDAYTLRRWVERLSTKRDAAVGFTSERDVRIWELYMAASAVDFEAGTLGLAHLLGSKQAALPLGRTVDASGDPPSIRHTAHGWGGRWAGTARRTTGGLPLRSAKVTQHPPPVPRATQRTAASCARKSDVSQLAIAARGHPRGRHRSEHTWFARSGTCRHDRSS